MSTRQEVRYEGTPCKVLAVLENAIIIQRDSDAQFTVRLNDPNITIHDLPDDSECYPSSTPVVNTG